MREAMTDAASSSPFVCAAMGLALGGGGLSIR